MCHLYLVRYGRNHTAMVHCGMATCGCCDGHSRPADADIGSCAAPQGMKAQPGQHVNMYEPGSSMSEALPQGMRMLQGMLV